MSPEKDKLLCEKYPKIFCDRTNPDNRQTLMCYGFCCDDGWFDLIDTLCMNIQHHCDHSKECTQVVAAQVKEKFGALRYYVEGGDDYVYGLIDMAQSMSNKICETCGNPGIPRSKGWIKTRCDKCEEEHKSLLKKEYTKYIKDQEKRKP